VRSVNRALLMANMTVGAELLDGTATDSDLRTHQFHVDVPTGCGACRGVQCGLL
jgi:hypothetical protein